MCPASQFFLESVRNKRIAHDGDPELRRHVLNMRKVTTSSQMTGWKFGKHPRNDETPEHGHFKTDMGLAAVAAAYQVESGAGNPLEEFGLFI